MKRNEKGKPVLHWGFIGKDKSGDKQTRGNITIQDITSDASIVVGRGGAQLQIDQRAVSRSAEYFASQSINHPQFDDLVAEVQNSDLSTAHKQELGHSLDLVRREVERGEAGDVRLVREALAGISQLMPQLREPLWQWLEECDSLSTPVKIIARQLLT